MKLYSIRGILIVFLLIVIVVSCNKERLSHSTTNPLPPIHDTASTKDTTSTHDTTYYSVLSSVSDSDKIFYFLRSSSYPINCNGAYCTEWSRYILRRDGSFLLQYDYDSNVYKRGIEYKGWYSGADSLSLSWEGSNLGGPWGATAKLRNDTLTVTYNLIMQMSGFDDAVYLRKR